MSNHVPHERPPTRRKPLGDATSRVNNAQPSPQAASSSKTPIPHHESLKPGGNLNVGDGAQAQQLQQQQQQPQSQSDTVENRRISAVVNNEYHHDSNRNSHISTTSTNASGKSRRKTHVGPWRLGRTLGRGATGRVRLAKHAVTGQFAAIKIVSKASATMVQSSSLKGKDIVGTPQEGVRQMPFGIEREVVIMKLIEHPNVVSLYDVWENRGELYLVLEYIAGGELFDYVVQAGRLQEMEAVRYFRQIMAALTYCHAFNICHRDLKPENILLDQDKNIKIADFGMAALQPSNSLLRTACGSPHYAPPEIVKGQRYNGNKADIWSCGVILFVMLCGYTPFDDENVRALLDKVRDGWFAMPEPLSEEAKDLIWRILEVDPRRRISMDQIWRHPLIRKYEAIDPLAYDGYYPPIPSVESIDHPIRRRSDIDGEILRNLQTLWHGEKREIIVQRLMSEESNQEKVFYCLLLKYREDRLEDYQGTGLEHSASDYHHSRPPPRKSISSRHLHSQNYAQTRRRSQFSIVSNDHDRPRESYYEDPVAAQTVESYDPFRSSRNPVSSPTADHANVTVFRKQSASSRSRAGSVQHKAVTRLNNGQRVNTRGSITSSAKGSAKGRATPPRKNASSRSYASKSSLSSSVHRNSAQAVKRPSEAHKRGVSFTRFQKSLSKKAARAREEDEQQQQSKQHPEQQQETKQTKHKAFPKPAPVEVKVTPEASSPPPEARPAPRSRKAAVTSDGKPRTQSHIWREEARKVSNELEKFCDEAFNRSSVSSSGRTSGRTTTTDRTAAYESPISSICAPDSTSSPILPKQSSSQPAEKSRGTSEARPLPPAPLQSADSFTESQLAETRERLLQRAAQGVPAASQGYLDEVIAHLDRLMQPSTSRVNNQDLSRRIASATPDCKSPNQSGYLPAITEEERTPEAEELHRLLNRSNQAYRAASEPLARAYRPQTRNAVPVDERDTIRVVAESSPAPITPIAPLNVRKRSDYQSSGQAGDGHGGTNRQAGSTTHLGVPAPHAHDHAYDTRNLVSQPLVSAQQGLGNFKTVSADPRKKAWYKRGSGGDERQVSQTRQGGIMRSISMDRASLSDARPSRPEPVAKLRASDVPSEGIDGPEPEKRKSSGSGKRGFLRIFSRRDSEKDKLDLSLSVCNDFDDASSTLSNQVGPVSHHARSSPASLSYGEAQPQAVQPQRNWLTRFLHIKPATKVLCFDVGRLKARREIAGILKDWRKYGLRDVALDKSRNVVFGRVDAQNFLHIRPVSFAAEIFTVLEHGKRANLSIARFTQDTGAASSFHKVVDTLETVLSNRDILIRDPKRRRAMTKVLA